MNLRIVFRFKDCKLQFYEKRRLFSYSIENPRTPASHWLLFHPATILSKKGRHFRLLITRQKLSNPLKSLKSRKSLQESTNRASERVPFSTSYLQLALAHARNSRVKNDINTESYCWCFTCAQLIQIKYIKSITDSKLCFLNSLSL